MIEEVREMSETDREIDREKNSGRHKDMEKGTG